MRFLLDMKHKNIKKAQIAYIKFIMDKTGLSLSALAKKCGIHESTLTRPFNKKNYKHNYSATTMGKIENLTGIKQSMTNDIISQGVSVELLRVAGVAAAGTWLEAAVMDDDTLAPLPIPPLPKYAGYSQYGILISGTSLNKKAHDGSYAICVSYDELELSVPPEHKFVHIQRTRAGIIETTIKKIIYRDGKVEFCPHSNDPKHTQCLTLSSPEDDILVEIKGLVIGWFTPED